MITFGPKLPIMVSGALADTYLIPGNALLRAFQALLQANVIAIGLDNPPGSPGNGDMYIVGAAPTGAWAGQANGIAYWSTDNPQAPSGEWEFYSPLIGWTAGNQTDGHLYVYSGSAWVSVGSGGGIIINPQSSGVSAYTANLSDANCLVTMDSASASTFTVPPNSSAAYPIGTVLAVQQLGVGQITVTPAGGVTINTPSSLTTRAQYSSVGVVQVAANTWTAIGDMT